MNHLSGRVKLNVKPSHKRSMMRNQVMTLIEQGHLVTTKARAKEAQRFAERLVTLARDSESIAARRRAHALLPYKDAVVVKLFKEIAPRYLQRKGGYTRVILMGRRVSDTAEVARLEWV